MKLLERYLQAVRFLLPRGQQDDIIRELRENLHAQMEDREEDLGRPLNEMEEAAILQAHGHPIVVAGRYGWQRQLIGPALLPIYWFSLKVGLVAAGLVTVLLGVVNAMVVGEPARQLVLAMLEYPGRALIVFAWTTLGFAALDYAQSRWMISSKWDPTELPQLVASEHFTSRAGACAEMIVSLLAVIWLLLLPQNPWLLLGPAAVFLDPAPVWLQIYPVLLLATAATAILAFVNFLRPYWTPKRSMVRMALHATSLGVLAFLWQAGVWVLAKPGVALPGGAAAADGILLLNKGIAIALIVAAVMILIEVVREIFRWGIRRRASAAAVSDRVQAAR